MNDSQSLNYPKATIINSGWILVDLPELGYGRPKDNYIGHAIDLSAKTLSDRLVWPLVIGTLTLILIAAAIVNLIVYVKRGVKRDFLMLATILHIRSIFFGANIFFLYVAPVRTGNWESPDWSCKMAMVVGWVTGIYGTNIESLISYERRLCISSNSISYKSKTWKIVAIAIVQLTLCILMSVAFLVWPFNTVMVESFIIEGINDNQPIAICSQWDINFVNDFDTSFLMIVYYSLNYSFAIPFLGYNYWKAFRSIANLHVRDSSTANSAMSTTSKNQRDWQRREIYMFKLSVLIFVVFVLTFLPAFWSSFAIATWRIGGYQVEVAWYRKLALSIVLLGSILSAILQTMKPSHLEIWFDKFGRWYQRWRGRNGEAPTQTNRVSAA